MTKYSLPKLVLNNVLILIYIINFTFYGKSAAESYGKIIFKNMHCSIHSKKVKSCDGYTSYKDNRSVLNLMMEYNVDIMEPHTTIQFTLEQNAQRNMNLFSINVDLCKAMKSAPRRSVIQILWKQIVQAAINLPNKCPIKKDIPIGFNGFYIGVDLVPSYVPLINFSASGMVLDGTQPLLTVATVGIMCRGEKNCRNLQ